MLYDGSTYQVIPMPYLYKGNLLGFLFYISLFYMPSCTNYLTYHRESVPPFTGMVLVASMGIHSPIICIIERSPMVQLYVSYTQL